MSTVIVEHIKGDQRLVEFLDWSDDLDLSNFKDVMKVWVCEHPEEVEAVKEEYAKRDEI